MPTFYDIGGVQVANATPNISYGALAAIQPLKFGQGVQFQPGAQWVVPEQKPYIAQGIERAFSAIGQGITNRQKNKEKAALDAVEKEHWEKEFELKKTHEARVKANDEARLGLEKQRVAHEGAKKRAEEVASGAAKATAEYMLGKGDGREPLPTKSSSDREESPEAASLLDRQADLSGITPADKTREAKPNPGLENTRIATAPPIIAQRQSEQLLGSEFKPRPLFDAIPESPNRAGMDISDGADQTKRFSFSQPALMAQAPSFARPGEGVLSLATPPTEEQPFEALGAPIQGNVAASMYPSAVLSPIVPLGTTTPLSPIPRTQGATLASMAPSSARSAAGASPQAQQPAAPTPSPVQFPGRANLPADQGVQIAIQQSEQPYAVVPQRRELPRIGQLGLVNGDPVYTAKAAEAWIERYNREGNPNWRAEGLLPDGKGGYKIEYVNVAQERNKAKTELNKLSAQERTEIRKLTLQEGRGISLHPDFKNFLAPNGARPQTRAFVTAFNSATEYPKQAGVADLDMINSYIRATSGGKVTENEVHSLKDAASWADKFLQKADKPLAGSILSKGQREQMLRTMLEMHNGAAEASNFVLNTARERMIKGGEKNEINLPQPYESELILKSDALDLLTKKKAEYLRLQESFKAAKRAGNEGEAQAINNGMVQLALESEHIQNRYNKEKYSSSNILGYKDWVHKYQGYVAGVGSALDMLDRSAE